jgi:hypothetical protein
MSNEKSKLRGRPKFKTGNLEMYLSHLELEDFVKFKVPTEDVQAWRKAVERHVLKKNENVTVFFRTLDSQESLGILFKPEAEEV